MNNKAYEDNKIFPSLLTSFWGLAKAKLTSLLVRYRTFETNPKRRPALPEKCSKLKPPLYGHVSSSCLI